MVPCRASWSGLLLLISLISGARSSSVATAGEGEQSGDDISVRTHLFPPYAGLDPLYEQRSLTSYLFPRACLANGSNYCFGNSVDFCSNCGTCCTGNGPNFCCADAASTCCGTGCCKGGEVCVNGQCAAAVTTTTTTTTVVQTVSKVATVVVSVNVQVDMTSTVVSTVEVTVSNIDTATEVMYTTTIVAPKRSLPTSPPANLEHYRRQASPGYVLRLSHAVRKLVGRSSFVERDGPISPFEPRFDPVPWTYPLPTPGATIAARADPSTVTVVVTVTSTVEVTSTATNTVTALTTNVALVTSYQTRTSVLNAKATVSSTSTIVATYKPPVTETRTAIATVLLPAETSSTGRSPAATGDPTPFPVTSSSSQLPTPTIIGLGVGCGIAAILLAWLFLLAWRWRRRRQQQRDPALDSWYLQTDPTPGVVTPHQFTMTPPPRHPLHTVEYSAFTRMPRSSMGKSNRSSAQTTLKPGSSSGNTSGERTMSGTYSYVTAPAAEMSGSTPPERHEMAAEMTQVVRGRHGRSLSDGSLGMGHFYRS